MKTEKGVEVEPGSYPVAGRRFQEIPERLRPREQFERLGAENVSEDVLIALILRSGVRKSNVIEIAGQILKEYGSLTALSQAPVEELEKVEGLGKVKAQVLKAALELARRLAEESTPDRKRITTPEDAASVLREEARTREGEAFWVLCLDTRNGLKRSIEVTSGLLDASLVHPREVFKEAIRMNSASIVLVHNHPSGDPSPSREDIEITRQLIDAGRVIDIRVLDHVILGLASERRKTDFVSLREEGLVSFSD